MSNKLCTVFLALTFMVTPLHANSQNDSTVVVISLDAFPAYALNDQRLPIPTIRALARSGSIANSMRPINPTITWPNHTALVTGVDASKHHVMFNGLLTYPATDLPVKIEQWRDKTDMVGVETVYDAAYRAGLTTAQIDWVAIYNAKTITWQFPEIPNPDGVIEKAMIDAKVVTQDQVRNFDKGSQAWRDRVWTEAAAYVLRTDHPNLMLFHLLDLDSTQHQYGPMNTASFNAMAFLDDRVKDILEAVRASGRLDKTTILLVSDHGSREAKRAINLNVLLRQNGIVHDVDGYLTADAWAIPEGGCAMVYISDPSKKAKLLPQLHKLFEKTEGVKHVYNQEEYGTIGLPTKNDTDQSPDLFLSAEEQYFFAGNTTGGVLTSVYQNGSHGFMNDDPQMQEIFIASGAHIRSGVNLGSISNLRVAPTIARILGIALPAATQPPLTDILQ